MVSLSDTVRVEKDTSDSVTSDWSRYSFNIAVSAGTMRSASGPGGSISSSTKSCSVMIVSHRWVSQGGRRDECVTP
eukprot:6324410-Pyramimonas_sp.AAC.1